MQATLQHTSSISVSRRWQFSLRALCAVLFISAILLTLVAFKRTQASREAAAASYIASLGGQVYFDYQLIDGRLAADATLDIPNWLTNRLGTDFFRHVVYVDLRDTPVSNQDLERLTAFRRLRWLDLQNTAITDEGLTAISRSSRLERLGMQGVAVTDAGLQHLGDMPHLNLVLLDGTQITERGANEFRQQHPHCRVDTGGPVVSSSP